jgi:hypothetical protein
MKRGLPAFIAVSASLLALALAPAPALGDTPPIRHVFVIVLENESAKTTFGTGSPAPYLARTLTAQGAFLPEYHGIGHESNDNYIAMISGQAPNLDTQTDCQIYGDFATGATGQYGQQEGLGCVYPRDIQTVAGQLDAAGLTWRSYNEGMGDDPAREAAQCGHPALGGRDGTQSQTATDAYATRHDPFVYFHSIIDNTALCDSHVVNLDRLPQDLSGAARTPNYVFITPDLCSDGHDATCKAPKRAGGFAGIEQFLKTWVPRITASPAYRQQNGLLIVTFDEASTTDAGACCGEIAGPGSPTPGLLGPGGGTTGAVLLSPCIKPGTVTSVAYNHYSMLRSVEDVFGLGHLGYAGLPGVRPFGTDVFTAATPCAAPPRVALTATRRGVTLRLRWSSNAPGAAFWVQSRSARDRRFAAWHTLLRATARRSLATRVRRGRRYQFRVRARNGIGLYSRWRVVTVRG